MATAFPFRDGLIRPDETVIFAQIEIQAAQNGPGSILPGSFARRTLENRGRIDIIVFDVETSSVVK